MPTEKQDQKRHLIVDTDTGIDDALALLYLAARPGRVRIEAVTSVYGNSAVDNAVLNIGHMMRLAGIQDVPVAVGAAGPMRGSAHIAHYVHGNDGLSDVVDPADKAQPATVGAQSAADYLIGLATERPGYYDLLTLGPLTNIGLALQRQPDRLTLFRQVVSMGGSSPTWTSTNSPRGGRVSPVHDGLAAALAIRPDLITASVTGPVNIITDGFATRGHLMRTAAGLPVAWTPEPAPDSIAVTGVDIGAFQHDFLDALIGSAAPIR